MATNEEADIHAFIKKEFDVDTSVLEFKTVSNQEKALALDVQSIRDYPLLNKGVIVGGAIYDVTSGKITPVDC
jgi:carbonic anhydrase